MADDAVSRLTKVLRAREDATRAAMRDIDRGLRRLAELEGQLARTRAAVAAGVDQVVQIGVLDVDELAAALSVDASVLRPAKAAERLSSRRAAGRVSNGG